MSRESRIAENRQQKATALVEATDAAQAKWEARVAAGMPVAEALRAAYIDGVSKGLNVLAEP